MASATGDPNRASSHVVVGGLQDPSKMSPKEKDQVAEQTITAPSKLENEVTTDNNQAESTVDIRKGYLKGIRLAVVTFSLCLGTFLVALDVNIIGVAVPRIATAFKSLDDVAWYGSGYLLTVTAFQPTMGVIYKYFDVRVTYIAVILIFEGKGSLNLMHYLM